MNRQFTMWALLVPFMILVSACGEYDAPVDGDVQVLEPEFHASGPPTVGHFGGSVAARSFPGGLGIAVSLPGSDGRVGYRFFLQQNDPVEGLAGEWTGAELEYNRDAVLVKDASGVPRIMLALSEPGEKLVAERTINHEQARSAITFEGYGLSYGKLVDEQLYMTDFVSGTWSALPQSEGGIQYTPCEDCNCPSGGAGSTACSIFGQAGGGCSVQCESGQFSCCHRIHGCMCCSTALQGHLCEASRVP